MPKYGGAGFLSEYLQESEPIRRQCSSVNIYGRCTNVAEFSIMRSDVGPTGLVTAVCGACLFDAIRQAEEMVGVQVIPT